MPRLSITRFEVRRYLDNNQLTAYCTWADGSITSGYPGNIHMLSLLLRADRDGVTVEFFDIDREAFRKTIWQAGTALRAQADRIHAYCRMQAA